MIECGVADAASVEVEYVAMPVVGSMAPVPIGAPASRNVTVPVGIVESAAATVAVNVTLVPNAVDVGETMRDVVVTTGLATRVIIAVGEL